MTDDSYIAFLPDPFLNRYISDPDRVRDLVAHTRRVQEQLRALIRCASDHGVPAEAITDAVFGGGE